MYDIPWKQLRKYLDFTQMCATCNKSALDHKQNNNIGQQNQH